MESPQRREPSIREQQLIRQSETSERSYREHREYLSATDVQMDRYLLSKESVRKSEAPTKPFMRDLFGFLKQESTLDPETKQQHWSKAKAMYHQLEREGGLEETFNSNGQDERGSQILTHLLSYCVNESLGVEPNPEWSIRFQAADRLSDVFNGIDAFLVCQHNISQEELVIAIDITTAPEGSQTLRNKMKKRNRTLQGTRDYNTGTIRPPQLKTNNFYRSPFSGTFAFDQEMPLVVLAYPRETLQQISKYWATEHSRSNPPSDAQIFTDLNLARNLKTEILQQLSEQQEYLEANARYDRDRATQLTGYLEMIINYLDDIVQLPAQEKGAADFSTTPVRAKSDY